MQQDQKSLFAHVQRNISTRSCKKNKSPLKFKKMSHFRYSVNSFHLNEMQKNTVKLSLVCAAFNYTFHLSEHERDFINIQTIHSIAGILNV